MEREVHAQAFQRDPAYIREYAPTFERIVNGYFAPEARGLERLPDEGPFLLVANHSGGMVMPDAWVLGQALVDRFGAERPVYALAFDFVFAIPGVGAALRKFGAVPASVENAEHALDLGAGVLVYPGGDWEVYRPWTQRNRVDFHDHVGFIRLALRRGVPVFPAVSHGSHHSIVVISRGDRLAHALGLDRLRIDVFPIILGLPFGLSSVLAPSIPLPVKVVVEVLEPPDWSAYGPASADDPGVLRRCYEEITGRMQVALEGLAHEVRYPLWSRLVG